MCGIAGFLGSCENWSVAPRAILQRMVSAIRHRGPDDWGIHLEGGLGLGHARLSIIDIGGGAQPMALEDRSLRITFNGEIFNYLELREQLIACGCKFRTNSDTEVILHAYRHKGLDCLTDFNGDFAFALWDRNASRLILARDRIGVRPLYYAVAGGVLVFASEVKALLECPGVRARIDPQALMQSLILWHPLAPRTIFRGISELPPGHYLVSEQGRISVRPYWHLQFPSQHRSHSHRSRTEPELAEELRELLLDATRLRLRADVPVGAYLSGGLDSSAVAGMTRHLAPGRLKTFSIRFEGAEFDEGAHQEKVARSLGCDHHSEVVDARSIGRAFPEVIRHIERPVLRTAPAPMFRLSSLVRRNDFKVVLTGEGADELFGGYDLFKEAKVRRFWARQPSSRSRPMLLRRLYPYLAGLQNQPQSYLQAFFKVGLDRPDDPLFSHLPRWATTAGIAKFLSDDLLSSMHGYDPVDELRSGLPAEFSRWDAQSRAQYLETAHLLPGYILSAQGDRVAMAHGIEGRFPFLDPRVIDFAAQLPPRLRLRGLTEKYLLRRGMAAFVPGDIAARPKQPYRAPDGMSFFGPGAPEYVDELLSPQVIAHAGYFDSRAVGRLAGKFRSGAASGFRDNMALVGILSVQLLDRIFVRAAPAAVSHSRPAERAALAVG